MHSLHFQKEHKDSRKIKAWNTFFLWNALKIIRKMYCHLQKKEIYVIQKVPKEISVRSINWHVLSLYIEVCSIIFRKDAY